MSSPTLVAAESGFPVSSNVSRTSQTIIAVYNNVGEPAFLGPNQKKIETHHREAYKFIKSEQIDTILSDSERYDVGLPEYVKIMRNIYSFQSKEFWAQVPHFSCSISLSILVI